MTIEFPKSFIDGLPYDFAAELAKHIAALELHREEGNAAPHTYAEVEVAVRRVQHPVDAGKPDDFVADYIVVDDTPPPPTLAERKAAALAELRKQEQAEIDAVIPPEKVRLAEMTFKRAVAKPEDSRTGAERKTIADYQALQERCEAIQFDYATREAALAAMV